MISNFLSYTWDVSRGIDLGFLTLRYYSLLFALGFVIGYFIMKRIFQKENIPLEWLDQLVTYVVVATVVGARLGHVFFYQWDYYQNNLWEILQIWEGGLASHGAAVAIIIALYIFSKKVSKKDMRWILDRVVITVALAGCFIRFGNMMNSEIYGAISNSSIETVYVDPPRDRILKHWDMVQRVHFQKTGERTETDHISYPHYEMQLYFPSELSPEAAERLVSSQVNPYLNRFPDDDLNIIIPNENNIQSTVEGSYTVVTQQIYGVPRYPTQVIEAVGYLLIFILLFTLFKTTSIAQNQGQIFGLFLITIFGFRFFIEFYKANQVAFEENLSLNMGQYLSIPLVIAGLLLFIFPKKVKA